MRSDRFVCVAVALALAALVSATTPSLFDEQTGDWKTIPAVTGSVKPPAQAQHLDSKEATIFLAVAHYKDARCGATIKSAFTAALNPDRVRVGVVAHVDPEKQFLDCRADYCRLMGYPIQSGRCPHADQIQQLIVSWKDARSPGVSRSLHSQQLHDEQFCAQVDAHSTFAQGWDTDAVVDWQATGNEYAVLSTQPPDMADVANRQVEGSVNHVCQATFTSSGVLRFLSPRRVKGLTTPLLAPSWSGGFSFSRCHAVRKVPHDPSLLFLFDGEEFSHYARLWTRGYDVYSPSKPLVSHDSGFRMKDAPEHSKLTNKLHVPMDKEWVENGQTPEFRRLMFDNSKQRVQTLLDMEGGTKASATSLATLQQYGLGNRRSLDQFMEFAGVDLRQLALFADACEARQWVPFVADSDAELSDGDVWGLAAEVAPAGAADVPLSGSRRVEMYAPALKGDGVTLPVPPPQLPAVADNDSRSHRSNPFRERSPMLWMLMGPVDAMLEEVVAALIGNDGEAGRPHAVRAAKLLLLMAPAALLLLLVGAQVASGGSVTALCDDGIADDDVGHRGGGGLPAFAPHSPGKEV